MNEGFQRKADEGVVVAVWWLGCGGLQFEVSGGFLRFIGDTFHLESATEKEKERALERLKKLYEQVLADYVEHLIATQGMPQGMPLALPQGDAQACRRGCPQGMQQGMQQGMPQGMPAGHAAGHAAAHAAPAPAARVSSPQRPRPRPAALTAPVQALAECRLHPGAENWCLDNVSLP